MSVRGGDSSPIPQEVLEASMKTYEAEQSAGWPQPPTSAVSPASNPSKPVQIPVTEKTTPSQHPALGSGFLNPVVPSTPAPRQVPVSPSPQPPSPAVMVGTSPMMMMAPQPLPPPPAPAIPFEILQTIESLKIANFSLQEKFETAMSKIVKLEKDKSELLDRLEQTLLMAAKLKDIETDRNQVRDKLNESEKELRRLFHHNKELENELVDRTNILTSVRSKYFAEREVNEKLGEELRVVSTVTEIAKKEVENQISRNNLREVQLSTARNLQSSSQVMVSQNNFGMDDELQMAKNIYENALLKTANSSAYIPSSDLKSSQPFPLPIYADWRGSCQHVSRENFSSLEQIRGAILGSSQSRVDATVFDDGIVRVRMDLQIQSSDTATMKFIITNIAPYIVQSVRLVGATISTSSHGQIIVEPSNEPAVYLRPGQSSRSVVAKFEANINSSQFPSICLTYVGSGGVPTNNYIRIPISLTKFFTPMKPSVTVVIDRWNDMRENEIMKTFYLQRDEYKSLSEIVVAGEIGGNFSSVRMVDMNPRGCVFVAAWGAGKHGPVREIISRIELSGSDWPGPIMCRITVRSSLITLSRAVMETYMMIFS